MKLRVAAAVGIVLVWASAQSWAAESAGQRQLDIVHDAATKANRPIEFFGQVVDQAGIPVGGATVELSVRSTAESALGASGDVIRKFAVTTDAQGKFALKGAVGSLLTITALTKPGYEAENPIGGEYWYAPYLPNQLYTPDPHRPEVLKLWKLARAAMLVVKDIPAQVPYGASATEFDLIKGKVVRSGGDLSVAVQRGALREGQTEYDWTATVRAPTGGVVVTTEAFMYLAPAAGYQAEVVLPMSASQADWAPVRSLSLYVKSRNGHAYARVVVDIGTSPDDRPWCAVSVRSFLNPSGQRNLEYNPNQDIHVRP